VRGPWLSLWTQEITGVVSNQIQGFVPIPVGNLFATWRFDIEFWTFGTSSVRLHFGFNVQEASAPASQRIQFDTLNGNLQSSLRTMTFDNAAIGTQVKGSPPGILPAIVGIRLTTTGGAFQPDGTIRISVAFWGW